MGMGCGREARGRASRTHNTAHRNESMDAASLDLVTMLYILPGIVASYALRSTIDESTPSFYVGTYSSPSQLKGIRQEPRLLEPVGWRVLIETRQTLPSRKIT